MVMGTLGKYSRSVSIIGVGCTPFMYTVDNPETDGLTEGEMFGYAALKAMEDAGSILRMWIFISTARPAR